MDRELEFSHCSKIILLYLQTLNPATIYAEGVITKLHHLQTLDLGKHSWVRELPSEFYKFTNLKHLRIAPRFLLAGVRPLIDMLDL